MKTVGIATRVAFGETLAQLGREDANVVALEADLGKSTHSMIFQKQFADRYFQMGVAESNMIGVAAGLALCGKIPFACSFSIFLTGKFDVIRMSVAYPNVNVKLIGTHAGVGPGEDGNSQQALQDIAIMRSLPNMMILQPADAESTRILLREAYLFKGPVFIRLTRQPVANLYDNDCMKKKLVFGKATVLRVGEDITVFATGAVVAEALHAAQLLEQDGLNIGVVDIHSIKPLDEQFVLDIAKKSRGLVVVEDHSVIGGLGSAIAELISEFHPVSILRIGIPDCFGESGSVGALYGKFGLDAWGIRLSILKKFCNENK